MANRYDKEATTAQLKLLEDETWSEDEGDYLDNIAAKQNLDHGLSLQPMEINASKGDRATPKLFSGQVKTLKLQHASCGTESEDFDVPLPHVPPHVTEVLGCEVVRLLWHQFLLHDSDESELILVSHLSDIDQCMQKKGHILHFDELDIDSDGNEYTDFAYVIDKLATSRNRAGVLKPVQEQRVLLPPCCATGACFVHTRAEQKVLDGDDRPDFRLDVIYRRWVLDKRGIVRVNDAPAILDEADVEYDRDLVPSTFWIVRGDSLLLNYEELAEVASQIRLDREDEENQLDLYRLPRWLMNEFIPEEIAMFRHHFMMIDVDHGGSIDAEELQLLGESLGNKLSVEEAEHLIAEHDDDNSGTIDFAEFMGLMFKILRGTVDVENDKLGKAMMESRSQIKLFQEIENIKEFPPDNVKVKQYGGNPVECEYYLYGPAGSLYEAGTFVFKVVYLNGYPYNCPECFMMTRIVGVNMITQTNGYSVLPHIKLLWDTSWNSRRLLAHVLDLMVTPMPSYLEPEMISIVNGFLKENFEMDSDAPLVSSAFGGGGAAVSETNETYQDRLARLPRLAQMHLNIVALFLSDRERYDDIVGQYVSKFAMSGEVS